MILLLRQLQAQVAESAKRVSNGAAAASSSLHHQSGYTAGDAEGGAVRSLGEDGEEAPAVAVPAAEANGAEDMTEKVATMQAEVGGMCLVCLRIVVNFEGVKCLPNSRRTVAALGV